MTQSTINEKFSLPMRWLAVAAGIEVGLVILAATPVQSETIAAAQVTTTASSLVAYARDVAQSLRHTETGFLPLDR